MGRVSALQNLQITPYKHRNPCGDDYSSHHDYINMSVLMEKRTPSLPSLGKH